MSRAQRFQAPTRRAIFILAALAAASCASAGDREPSRIPEAPPGEVDLADVRADMLLETTAPIVVGRNAMWCATTQLAWDALGDALLGKGSRMDLGPPAPPAVVAGLNRRDFPHGDLDADSYVVEAGFARDHVVERFQSRLAKRGVTFPLAIPALDSSDCAAFAYLKKDLPFRQPFWVHERPLAFAGGPRRVVAFGLPGKDGPSTDRMAEETLLHEEAVDPVKPRERRDLALELLPTNDADRIVLADIERPKTLTDGWARVAGLLAERGSPLASDDELLIPKVDFAATHEFQEIVGASLVRHEDWFIRAARQRIEFTLSEKGARLVAAVVMAARCSAAPPPERHITFDRPYLLALVRKGATRPYFLVWFENDGLFVKTAKP